MNPPATQANVSPPWFLIVGLIAGVAFIGYIVWDSTGSSSTSNKVVLVTEATWQKEVVESPIPVVVDFTAAWCGPCKAFAPTVNRMADRYQNRVKVVKFDVGDTSFDKARTLSQKYGIRGVPHILIFKGGDRPVQEFEGGIPEGQLAKAIDDVLASR